MTINELLQNGFEVKVKTGSVDDQFIRDVITLRVEVRKNNISGYGWREIPEESLGYIMFINVLIDKLLARAIDDYEKNERLIKTKSEIT